MTDTTDLIARLETAAERMDAGWHDDMCRLIHTIDPNSPVNGSCRNYTTSIDAALTLVSKGYSWDCTCHGEATVYVVGSHSDLGDFKQWSAEAATPALAICIAALKAKEQGR